MLEQLKNNPELMEALGIKWMEDGHYYYVSALNPPFSMIHFTEDDCPGSALLIVRALQWLNRKDSDWYLGQGDQPNTFELEYILDDTPLYLNGRSPTIVSAVLAACLAVLNKEDRPS